MPDTGPEEFFASAIKYDPVSNPRVIARGSGTLAKQITATARQHNIPILEDFALSKKLSHIPLGNDIPENIYFAIASLFGYILEVEEIHEEIHIGEWIPANKDNKLARQEDY